MCLDVFLQFFEKKLPKNLVMSKKSSTFAPAFGKTDNPHGPSGRKPAERLRTEERSTRRVSIERRGRES